MRDRWIDIAVGMRSVASVMGGGATYTETAHLDGARALYDRFAHEANCRIDFTVTTLPSSGYPAIAFREVDANNKYKIMLTAAGKVYLWEVDAGTEVHPLSSADGAIANGQVIEVICNGEQILVYANGVLVITRSDPPNWAASNFKTATMGTIAELGDVNCVISDIFTYPYPNTITTIRPKTMVCDGNSIGIGTGLASLADRYSTLLSNTIGAGWSTVNIAVAGQTLDNPAHTGLLNSAITLADPCVISGGLNIYVAEGGTNDIAGGQDPAAVYAEYVALCQARVSAGFKVVALTVLNRQYIDTALNETFNALVRANYLSFAHALANVQAIPQMINENDVAYYPDGIHPSAAGHALMAPVILAAAQSIG